MVVYTTADDEFRDVAERIAADRGEPVVGEFENAIEVDGPVVYVDHPSSVVERELLPLQRRLLDRGSDDGAFSVVTGYTPELAERLYFSREETNGDDVMLYNRSAPDQIPESPDTNILVRDAITTDAVQNITSETIRSLVIEGPGRPMHISISDGYVCGVPESQPIEEYPGPQPFCISDDERDCPLSDNLIPSESIDAAHLFILSCSSAIDNATFRLPTNVGLGLLNGAESLIAPYRISPGLPHEPLLHYSLLAAGYDLNERCYVLNQNAHVNAITSYPYVAFGKPDARVAEPHEPEFELDVESNGETVVEVTDVDAHVLDFRIPDEHLPAYDERLFVRNRTDTDSTVYYTAFEDGGDARFVVYTGRRMEFDRLELEVSGHRARYIEREIAFDSARNVRQTVEMGFVGSEVDEQIDQIENQIRALPEQTVDERYNADTHRDVEQHLGSVHGHVNAVREELSTTLTEFPEFLYYKYGKYAIDEDVYPSERTCTICNDRPLFVKQVVGWSGDARRLLGSCPRCGHVFDVPVGGKTTDPTYPIVRCDLKADGEREQPLEIEFENPTDVPMQATFLPKLTHMDNAENSYFEPERRDAILLPGETHTAEFTVDTRIVPDNTYFIMGQVIANLDVYAGFETTVKGGQAAYYPRHLR